jgi:radical SAM protein with 4Fe4S-binding SPASM domain
MLNFILPLRLKIKVILKENFLFFFMLIKRYPLRIYRNNKLKDSDFPHEIWIENTNHCNASCVMCPRELHTRSKSIMSFDLYKRLIIEISKYHQFVERVHMHNFGEPMLDKNLAEKVKFAKKNGIKHIYFVTNASLLNLNTALNLIKSGLDELKISFYGVNKSSYNNTMKNLDFDVTLNNIRNFFDLRKSLKATKPKVILQLIPQSLDDNSSEKDWVNLFKNYIDKKIGDKFNFYQLHNFGGGRDYVQTEGFVATNTCKFPWNIMVILQDGNVTACCLDYNGKINLGNVNEQSIYDIWNGERYREIRKNFKKLNYRDYKVCQKCNFTVD